MITNPDTFADASCLGLWEMFDSDDPIDVANARQMCMSCLVRLACGALLGQQKRDGMMLTGTWAGQAVGRRASRRNGGRRAA